MFLVFETFNFEKSPFSSKSSVSVYLCWTHVQDRFGMQNAYFDWYSWLFIVVWLVNRLKLGFKNLIVRRGYSERVADELWKWYDFSEKKGIASV
jgi:hypothetical protein